MKKLKMETLFLDEIGDLSPTSQTKLLRLLQEHEFMPLGSDMAKRSSARIITATHQSIAAMQEQGKFRKDLFFRLRGHMLQIPPLRERIEDLPLLISHFVDEVQTESGMELDVNVHDIADFLNNYSFPGNIRELQNLVHDGASICGHGELTPKHFKKLLSAPGDFFSGGNTAASGESISFGTRLPTLQEARSKLIDEALRRTNGNQSSAAQLVGVTRQAVSKYLKKNN